MQFFNNLNIGARLTAALAAIGVLLLAIAIVSIVMLGRLHLGTSNIVTNNVPQLEYSNDLVNRVNNIAISLRNMMLTDKEADRASQLKIIETNRDEVLKDIAALKQLSLLPQDAEQLSRVAEANARYTQGQLDLIKLILQGRPEESRAYLTDRLRPVLGQLKDLANEKIKAQNANAAQAGEDASRTYTSARNLMLVLAAAAIGLAALLGYLITTSITRPVARALQVANTVAAGDLTSDIVVETRDEMGQLLTALKRMNDGLAETVSTVRSGTDNIATSAREVASGSMDLSSRTEQQASSLEETASSMEELTSTVKQNADNARQAHQLAESASEIAQRGGDVIARVVTTMEQINESSGKIGDIIGVIDGIAFQTNILALNAAVEAARAGEQGRGFAVVATEVRNLAQRSATAAKEIKDLIDASSTTVASGNALVNQAGDTITELVGSVRRVTDIVAEITSASTEQYAGIEQINQAVTEMDDVTQQNAALVEQSAAAAAAMENQSQLLAQLVSTFKLRTGASPHGSAQNGMGAPVRPRQALPR
ncbi:chemotaxis protein [Duganella sp. Leaf126]|uniref:methyl-accepting chemotaxis protein n=1 Tax=Duganella sp. Leaf126 TaxID=1736266 RepID=UPI0006FC95A9|nr:methyl-accepting chemotaxis protein [Duganella sp. Leaf126]KQQ45784.1 chemotaxis protein [Duganella sp. Leaf126]